MNFRTIFTHLLCSRSAGRVMWAGFWSWFRIPSPPRCFLTPNWFAIYKTQFSLWHFSFIEKTFEMNESGWNFWNSIFYRIKKFDLKKKLELTKGTSRDNIFEIPWSTFHWETNANRNLDVVISIGFPMECWSWYFQNVVQKLPSVSSNFFLKTNFLIR